MQVAILRKLSNGSVQVSLKFKEEYRQFCYFDKDASNKPDYRNKYVTINGIKYHIMWDKR